MNRFWPNTTQTPDVVFDYWLGRIDGKQALSDPALRVLFYLIRRTYGFRREDCSVTLTEFQEGTIRGGRRVDGGCGIGRRQTVVEAIRELEAKGLVRAIRNGRSAASYELMVGSAPGGECAETAHQAPVPWSAERTSAGPLGGPAYIDTQIDTQKEIMAVSAKRPPPPPVRSAGNEVVSPSCPPPPGKKANWVVPLVDQYREQHGLLSYGEAGKALKPLRELVSDEKLGALWKAFLDSQDVRLGVGWFVKHWRQFDGVGQMSAADLARRANVRIAR